MNKLKDLDEQYLWTLYQTYKHKSKKLAIRNELIRRYIPLSQKIATQAYHTNLFDFNFDIEDVIGFAYLGLIDAVSRYSLGKQTKFSTYAKIRISGAIIDEVRKHSFIPRSVVKRVNDFRKYLQSCDDYLSGTKTEQVIAKEYGLSNAEYNFYMRHNIESINSWDNCNAEDEADSVQSTEASLVKRFYDHNLQAPDIHQAAEYNEDIDTLQHLLNILPQRNKSIITDIFFNNKTVEYLAHKHKISTVGIFQIKNKSLQMMRAYAMKHRITVNI